MSRNEGTFDRVARIIIGAILLAAGIWGGVAGALMWVLIIVGALGLITGLIGWCAIYAIFGWKTCKVAPKAEEKPAE